MRGVERGLRLVSPIMVTAVPASRAKKVKNMT